MSDTPTRVIQQTSQNRLVDVHRRDLVHGEAVGLGAVEGAISLARNGGVLGIREPAANTRTG
jgi:hypothetical protein